MTPLFGPGWGNYAIRGIVEIDVPAPPPFRPETPAWWVLLALLLALLARRAWQRYQRYRRNAYRRSALATLAALRCAYEAGDSSPLRELAPLLRATAITARGRADIAGLHGDAWQAAVDALAPGLTPLPTRLLHELAYRPLPAPADARHAGIFDLLEHWIRQHRDDVA